jgi:Flp pilus assembly protein TadG
MLAPERSARRTRTARRRQAGEMIVEFGLIVLLFLAFMFAVIELARLMFLTNTLQEATRRAANGASVSDPGNAASMDQIRRNAIFRTTPGGLTLMSELTDRAVRIDYMSVSRDSGGNYAMQPVSGGGPASAADNRHNCAVDPYAGNCVRLVRARICNPAITASCEPMNFKPMTSLFKVQIPLPIATTIVKAQSFGAGPG